MSEITIIRVPRKSGAFVTRPSRHHRHVCLSQFIRVVQSLLECLREGGYSWKPVLGLFCQGMQEYQVKRRGNLLVECAGRLWLSMSMLVYHLHKRTLEQGMPRKQFVGHHGERILVAGGDSVAFPLFWSHVDLCTANSQAVQSEEHT